MSVLGGGGRHNPITVYVNVVMSSGSGGSKLRETGEQKEKQSRVEVRRLSFSMKENGQTKLSSAALKYK